MSYILEALKKAQAERQLGNAPTIHAPQPVQAAQPGPGASRRPLFLGLGVAVLAVAAAGLFLWQRGPVPASMPAAAAPALAGPAVQPAGAVASGAASTTLEVSAPPAPVTAPAHVPAHVQATAPARVAEAPVRRAAADTLSSTAAPHAAQPAATPAAPVAAPEDSLPYLSQLPDTIQRDIPRVSFGGYMYSANPADRLLLVDKALRHEGEEVGPGLVLEKLLPKAAVMNYRGVRYRVAY